ncbi:hypothetical protein M885DRAFT_547229 [Pelagophyceae sp. CCMP2097]|nr:hypothetical protein M885DRAFT_547229 [Pelagophyceae sp. CCMP2097]
MDSCRGSTRPSGSLRCTSGYTIGKLGAAPSSATRGGVAVASQEVASLTSHIHMSLNMASGGLAEGCAKSVFEAQRSLLNGALTLAAAVMANEAARANDLCVSTTLVAELRALVLAQQTQLRRREARVVGADAATQTDADRDADARLECEREAARIERVMTATLQRKLARADDDVAAARDQAGAARSKVLSLERIIDHLQAVVAEKDDQLALSLDDEAAYRPRGGARTAPAGVRSDRRPRGGLDEDPALGALLDSTVSDIHDN